MKRTGREGGREEEGLRGEGGQEFQPFTYYNSRRILSGEESEIPSCLDTGAAGRIN